MANEHDKLEPVDVGTATAAASSIPNIPAQTPAETRTPNAKHEQNNMSDDDGDVKKPAVPNSTIHTSSPSDGSHPLQAPPRRESRFQAMLSKAGYCLFVVVAVPTMLAIDVLDKVRGRPRRNHWQ